MKISIGCDHAGCDMKNTIIEYLEKNNIEVIDCGTTSGVAVDYPDIAEKVCEHVDTKADTYGIVICGSGVGISIAANKVKGIRCALCSEPLTARLVKEHNDANVLAMGARMIGIEMALSIVATFINTPFSGEVRHSKRINKITDLENKQL